MPLNGGFGSRPSIGTSRNSGPLIAPIASTPPTNHGRSCSVGERNHNRSRLGATPSDRNTRNPPTNAGRNTPGTDSSIHATSG